jgi:hypothetical protein
MFTVEQSINYIKKKGFNFFKVELEAQVNYDGRKVAKVIDNNTGKCCYCNNTEKINHTCTACAGLGHKICSVCKGEKFVKDIKGHKIPCPYCKTKEITCDSCNGTGFIPKTCDKCYTSHPDYKFYSGEESTLTAAMIDFSTRIGDINKSIVFKKAYNDGSCNTEITLTLPIEFLSKLGEIARSFGDTINCLGDSSYLENSGMHIALLPTALYPNIDTLPVQKLDNFRKSMNKLMLATMICGSDGKMTRPFIWRDLRTSNSEKYSAIYCPGNKAIEYRIFDAVYFSPERCSLFIKTMAHSLKYYSNTFKPIKHLPVIQSAGRTTIVNKSYSRNKFTPLSTIISTVHAADRAREEMEELLEIEISFSGARTISQRVNILSNIGVDNEI